MARTRTVNGIEYSVSDAHPAAEILPWMSDAELVMLAEDIKAKGQLVPIDRTPDQRIIDGRNRELACRIAGIEPDYQRCNFTEAQIVGHVVSLNVPRRHLTPSQRAMVAAEFATMLQGDNRFTIVDRHQCRSTDEDTENPGVSQKQAAEMMDVSERSVRNAKAVQRDAPELVEPVKEGKIDVTTAAKVARLPKKKRKKVATAADPKKAAAQVLAEEAVAVAHEESDGEKEADPAAAFVSDVEALCRDMDQIAARLKALKGSPLSYCMHVDSAVSQVQAARQTIWQGRPAYSCPYCKGEGCDVCKRTGRVKKTTHDSGTKAMEGQS